MTSWISVEDRLPDCGEIVLGALQHWDTKNYYYDVIEKVDEDDCSWRVWDIGYQSEVSHDYDITHWMPLPSPPEDK